MSQTLSSPASPQAAWKLPVDTSKIDWSRFDDGLAEPFELTTAQVEQFKRDGYIKLKNVLAPAAVEAYGAEITNQVIALTEGTLPLEQRGTYGKAFLQISNLWTRSEIVKRFVTSPRLARLAAQLLNVRGVRLYHDQALYKEPGGGITPWHADQFYWPVDTDNTVTAWIPLQATPKELGPLAFSATSQRANICRDLEISNESEIKISKALLETGLPLIEEPFDLGEVSFHLGWTFHRAAANVSDRPRKVMTIIYFQDGCRAIEPAHKAHENDLRQWMPGVTPGGEVNSPINPVLWRAD